METSGKWKRWGAIHFILRHMLDKLGAVLAGSRVNLLTLSSTLHLGHPGWNCPGFEEKTFCFHSPSIENTFLVFLHQPGRTLKDRRSQFSVWSTVVGKLESLLRQSLLLWSASRSKGCGSTFERQVVQTTGQAFHSSTGKRNGGVGQTRAGLSSGVVHRSLLIKEESWCLRRGTLFTLLQVYQTLHGVRVWKLPTLSPAMGKHLPCSMQWNGVSRKFKLTWMIEFYWETGFGMLLVMGWLFRCFKQHHQGGAGDYDWLRVRKSYMEKV